MANYSERSKEELLDIARERDLAGRSTMSKDELAGALQRDDEEKGVDDNAADNLEGEKNEEGGRGLAQEEGQDFASRMADDEPSEEAQKAYQEEYVPQRQKEQEQAVEDGGDPLPEVGFQSEASDPENPLVEEAFEDREDYEDLDDLDKELADLALDASGPMKIQSPFERIMTGAVNEEQAKEQEAVRAKLPDEFVGNLTEHVSDEDAARVAAQLKGEAYDEQEEELEPPLIEQFKARREKYGQLLKRSNDNRSSSTHAEERTIHETQGEEDDLVGQPRLFQQRAVLDTTGLGGPASDRLDRAYRNADLRKGVWQSTFHAEDPRGRDVREAEQYRRKLAGDEE